MKGTSPLIAAEDGTTAANAPVADLRWLAAKLARPVRYSSRAAGQVMAQERSVHAAATPYPAATPHAFAMEQTARTGSTLRLASSQETTAETEIAGMQDVTVPAAQASVATVLQMMAGWQKETVDAR